MSKTKMSFALIMFLLLLALPSTAGAKDLLNRTVSLSPPLSFRSPATPVEQWQWADESSVPETGAADIADPRPGRAPEYPHFLTALFDRSILDGPGTGDSAFMHVLWQGLLRKKPKRTGWVLGVRYSFSEFDLGQFCESFFKFIARGTGHPAQGEPRFTLYVDSPDH